MEFFRVRTIYHVDVVLNIYHISTVELIGGPDNDQSLRIVMSNKEIFMVPTNTEQARNLLDRLNKARA